MRLALLYALMDTCHEIKAEHLLAALAVWEYIEKSVYYIFGDRTGDPVADRIYEAVYDAPAGLTRTEIFNLFNRHERKMKIEDCIGQLLRSRKVTVEKTGTEGRPIEKIMRFENVRNAQ